jgi:ABC-2 type transport system permease protein
LIDALIGLGLVAIAALRIRGRRRRRAAGPNRAPVNLGPFSGDVALVAAREVRERIRGKVFRVGTLLILAVVAASIVIPTLSRGAPAPERVGVVGSLSAHLRATVQASARSVGTTATFVPEHDVEAARDDLGARRIDLALIDGEELLVEKSIGATDTSTTAQFVRAASKGLGAANAIEAAHLSQAQASALVSAKALPIKSVQAGSARGAANATSIIGLILIFVMLTQYNTWILIGVMEEKASRVIEVLLAALRPIQLLAGKVIGIGLVAFGQATLIVAFALLLAKAVGSDLLHGTAPLVLVSTLIWLILGYAFYCWVFAAAGSLAERQDQVQSLAFPLSLPIIFGYVMALVAASSANPSPFFTFLAYFPPTAPLAMPVLVGLGAVTWWGFLGSAMITILCTVGMARLAANIYRRAILRTGGRVRLRDVLTRRAAS